MMKKVINYFIKLILVFLIFLVGGKEVLSQQCTPGQRYPIRENYSNYNWGNLKGPWYQGSNNSEWIPKYALPPGYPSYYDNIVEFKWSAPSTAYYSGLPSSSCPGGKGPCEYWALGNYYVISGVCQWFNPGWGCFGLRFSVSQTRTTWASNQDYNCNGIPNQYDTLPTHDWDDTDSDGDGVSNAEDPWPNDSQKPGDTMFRRLFRFFRLSDGKKIDMFAKADTPADLSYWFYAMDSDGLVNDLVQNRSNWGYESYGSGSSKTYSQWKAEFSPGFVVGASGSVIETLQNQIIVGVRVLPIGSWSGAKLKGMEVVTNGQGYVGFLFSNAEDSNVWKKWNGSSWVVYNNLRWDPSTPGWIVEEPLEGMSESEVEALGMDQWLMLLGSNPYHINIAVIERDGGKVESVNLILDVYEFPSFSIKSTGSLSGKAPHTVVLSADAEDLFGIIKRFDPEFQYEWDFGDGSGKAYKRVVAHTYKVAGTYTVTLDVWDKYSNHSQHTAQVVVSQPEDLTVRHFKVYYSNPYQRVPLKVILRPVLEYLPGLERVVSNQWSVGLTPVAQNKSQVVLAFNSAGDYQVNFSGTTNYGRSVSGQFALTVNPNQLPSCTMEYQDYPSLGYTKFTPSCVDPDGKVVSYYWEFGNGEVSKSRVGYAHYSQGGSYGVKLTVKDSSGESRTFSWDVSVTR